MSILTPPPTQPSDVFVPQHASLSTKLFYLLVFTPLVVVTEWVMMINWGIYACFILFGTVNIDYTSSLVVYLLKNMSVTQTGLIFVGITCFHVVGLIRPNIWLRVVPLVFDVAIILLFSGSLFVNKPIALGAFTFFGYVIVIIFGIIKAFNVQYTVYTIRTATRIQERMDEYTRESEERDKN